MTPRTYALIARRKDKEDGIDPWSFSEENPGYVWLLEKQEAYLDEDSARDPALAAKAVSAGPISSSKTFKTDPGTLSRVDIIETAIELYLNGVISLPNRTKAAFGQYKP